MTSKHRRLADLARAVTDRTPRRPCPNPRCCTNGPTVKAHPDEYTEADPDPHPEDDPCPVCGARRHQLLWPEQMTGGDR